MDKNEEKQEKAPDLSTKEGRDQAYKAALREADSEQTEEQTEGQDQPASKSPFVETAPGSLGKVPTEFDRKQQLHEENKAALSNIGFRKVDTANIPSKGEFNDPTMKIKIRAATLDEIKHYSSLDETDLIDVSDHINEILAKCCQISFADRVGSSEDLKEADKYYIFFAIRDLTMEQNQRYNKLWQKVQCPQCGKKSEHEITSHAFSSYTVPKKIMRHYDATERKIVVRDESFADGPLQIGVPSVGVTKAIQKYMQDIARKQQQQNSQVYFDADFMVMLQYIIDHPSQVNDAYLNNLQKKIAGWSADKAIAFNYIKENMDVGVSPKIEVVCSQSKSIEPHEGGCKDDYSFSAPVIFRQGWRSVLDISGVITRLFEADPE